MKVYTAENGRVTAEAESVADVRKLLALDISHSNTTKARAVLAEMRARGEIKHKGRKHLKTHTCGQKYRYLKWHLKKCPEVHGTPVAITPIP